MKKKWSENDMEFIKNTYPNFGSEYCAKQLNRTQNSIRYIVRELGLKMTDKGIKRTFEASSAKRLQNTTHKVDENLFIKNYTKHSAYILGLLWADGYIQQRGVITLSCVKEDMLSFKKILETCGSWTYYESKRGNTKTQISAITVNKKLTNFLIQHNYRSKTLFPTIVNKIPKKLQLYFFRGLIDGDGCFYENKKNKCYQFSLTSGHEQDWSFITTILNNRNIKYQVNKRIVITRENKENKSSSIRINSKKEIKKLGEYIYKNFNEDSCGLERKHNKFISITQK